MCHECVTVELPAKVWEIIDELLCIEWAQRVGLSADALIDQLRAKVRDQLNVWPEELFEFYIDRIRIRNGVQ